MFDKRRDSEPAASDTSAFGALAPENRARTPEPSTRGIAMIGKSIVIKGDISGEESLVVEGRVDGTIHLKNNDLTVGPSGRVNANVTANVVRIDGEVTGDIIGIEKVVVTKTGRVHGNIVGPRVTLEDGAKFKGSIDMDPTGADRVAASPSRPSATGGRPAAAESRTAEAAGKA
jgi:cytoskeletal protein CcmA (bactofilin family)